MKLVKKIFPFLFLLFLFGEVIRVDFGNGITLRFLDLGITLIFLLWIAIKVFKKESVAQKEILVPFLAFSLVGLIPIIFNFLSLGLNERLTSFFYLTRWLIYGSIFFVANDFDDKYKKLINKFLIVLGSAIVLVGFIQYLLYPNLRNLFYLGWDEHMQRMFSIFLDPNFAGAFFVLFFLFLIDNLLKKRGVLIGILLLISFGAIILTFSRSTLIMLIVGSMALFFQFNKKKYIFILLALLLLAVTVSSRYFDIENVNLFRITSSKARLESMNNALIIIEKNPIFGVGFNSYRYAQFKHGLSDRVNLASHAEAGVDNSLLFVLATTGIIGFLFYSLLWFRLLKIASPLAIASFIGLVANSMFINSLFYPFIMFWIWIIFALSIRNHN